MLAITHQFNDLDQLAERLGAVLESLIGAVIERQPVSELELIDDSKNDTL